MNVLITGANRGLGYEITAEALSRGHHIYAIVRSDDASKQLLSRLEEEHHNASVTVLIADVCDEASIEQAALKLQEDGVTLHGIINSAAVLLARQTAIEELDMADVQQSFDVNLFGPLRVLKHMLPLLNEGVVLNISSEAGSIQNAYAGDYPYSLSKCALNLLSEQLKRHLSSRGIAVWSIHPGWMRTDMGGEAAPLHPNESAKGIVDILEGKVQIESNLSFINYLGEAMKI